MSSQSPAPSAASFIAELLSKPPSVSGIEFGSAYFAPSPSSRIGSTAPGAPSRVLLPQDFQWRSRDADKPSVPLQLCEFLAYKTGLAYEPPARIKSYLETCCEGITPDNSRFRFFDSMIARDGDAAALTQARQLVDAQCYGFVFERKAFVIFRGTQTKSDWAINRSDALTGEFTGDGDKRYQQLKSDYGPLLDKLGNLPGRHVGFSIAWAALKDDVEDWLAGVLEEGAIDQIVYSGHSLGGAMAQLAAYDHAHLEAAIERDRGIKANHIAAVVTFGAPAVGSKLLAARYQELLGNRTVLLESSGDLVPRIMERWYYRMLYPLRQRIKAGVQMHLEEKDAYGKVATPWSFASEPPLSDNDIRNALNGIREAAQKALEKAAEQQKKPAKPAIGDAGSGTASAPDRSSRPGVGQPAENKAGNKDGKASNGAASPDASKPAATAEPKPTWVYWVVAGVVFVVVAGVAWYFVRRKLFSHDIEQRYALYLSTLAYQQLRAKHGGDLDLANADLDQHLAFVRGNIEKSNEIARKYPGADGKNTPFFSSVRTLPLRIKSELRSDPLFVEYLKKSETFV